MEKRLVPLNHVLSARNFSVDKFIDLRMFAHWYTSRGWKQVSIDYELESFVHSYDNYLLDVLNKKSQAMIGSSILYIKPTVGYDEEIEDFLYNSKEPDEPYYLAYDDMAESDYTWDL